MCRSARPSVGVSVILVKETESRSRPIPVHLPPRLEDECIHWVFDSGCWLVPLGVWLLGFPRCDVTSGSVTWPALMRSFSGAGRYGTLDLGDLTVEIILAFCILRSLGPINSGLNSVEILCFLFVSDLITEWHLVQCFDNRVIYRPPTFPQSYALHKVSYVNLISTHIFFWSSLPSSRSSFFFFFVLYHWFLIDRGGRGATSGRGSQEGWFGQCCWPVGLPPPAGRSFGGP